MTITTLPYPRHKGIKHAKTYTLTETLVVEQWEVPAGTQVKLATSQNFGICVLPENCKDRRGFTIPRRIFRY